MAAARTECGDPLDADDHGEPGSAATAGGLGALEVALAVVLLVGAGLFLGSFARVSSVDRGLDPTNVLAVRVQPAVGPGGMSRETAQQQNRGLLRNLADDVRRLSGVTDVALVGSGVPLRGDLRTIDFETAVIRIYGVMAYAVVQPTQEIGIRLALGAGPAAIQRSLLGTAAGYLGVGLTVSMLGAWLVGRLVSGLLF